MKSKLSQSMQLNVSADLHRRLKKYAAKVERPMSLVVREWLKVLVDGDDAKRDDSHAVKFADTVERFK